MWNSSENLNPTLENFQMLKMMFQSLLVLFFLMLQCEDLFAQKAIETAGEHFKERLSKSYIMS
jgi:hypothetical protein